MLWLLLAGLAVAQETPEAGSDPPQTSGSWPEPAHWPPITAPPQPHAETCLASVYVDAGAMAVREVTGCGPAAEAAFRAGLAGWTFSPDTTGALEVAVRFADARDPQLPSGGARPAVSELDLRRIVSPKYPRGITAAPQYRCLVHLVIEKNGFPIQGYVTHCPPAFHENALGALLQWRWKPPIGPDGAPVRASTVIGVTFRME